MSLQLMGNEAKKYAHCLRTHQAIPFKLRMTDFMARFGMILREVAEWTAYLDKAAAAPACRLAHPQALRKSMP
ncbi:hypothetical protein [Rhodomicrobium udaipurense]|uniref:hypothetical protein n=1 Tax=Rhodomicrobium udaipurense TaxID=1202716 RepID=UPI00138E10F7|nr:hypothetical protein [Rhodomicrobium udaipurense]